MKKKIGNYFLLSKKCSPRLQKSGVKNKKILHVRSQTEKAEVRSQMSRSQKSDGKSRSQKSDEQKDKKVFRGSYLPRRLIVLQES